MRCARSLVDPASANCRRFGFAPALAKVGMDVDDNDDDDTIDSRVLLMASGARVLE